MRRRTLIGTAAAVILAITPGLGATEQVLQLGTAFHKATPLARAIDHGLVEFTEKLSNGSLIIQPYFGGSVCREQKCGQQANQGLLAMWTSSTANFGNFGTALSIFDLPYLFNDQDTANQIVDSWLGDAASENAAKTTQHKVFEVFSAGGFRQLGNTERVIKSPADMKGIKFRVTKSPIEFNLIKTWGAIPVQYDWRQLYQGLQTGVVEGQYMQVPWQFVYKMHEVAKYYTETGGIWSGAHLSMDIQQYDKLTAGKKKWLLAGVDEFSKIARAADKAWAAEMKAALQRKNVEWYTPNDAEMAMWRDGAVKAWADAKGTYDPALAEKALEEQELDDFITVLKRNGAL